VSKGQSMSIVFPPPSPTDKEEAAQRVLSFLFGVVDGPNHLGTAHFDKIDSPIKMIEANF